MEYLIHFLSVLSKSESAAKLSPITNLFEFTIETRSICPSCSAIHLSEISSKYLTLPVPLPKDLDTYGNSGKQEDMEYKASLNDCINLFIHGEKNSKMSCSSCKAQGMFKRLKYVKTFPKYLIIQLTNFTMNGWVPKKLHCEVDFGELNNVHFDKLRSPAIPEGTVTHVAGDDSEQQN